MGHAKLNVLVLRGGPDRECEVSLKSGAEVAAALREAGHEVREADVMPDDLAALDAFAGWGDVVFPVLHGRWGEGGDLQRVLTDRELPFVGSAAPAAELCMDKHRTKLVLEQHDILTPRYELLGPAQRPMINPPLVLKVPQEGSSFGLAICHTDQQVREALHELHNLSPKLMAEEYVAGHEITVGVIAHDPDHPADDQGHSAEAIPPIHIIPAGGYYDFDAKYIRDDTQYRFDLPGPADIGQTLRSIAYHAYRCLGCRHLARVDFMLDHDGQPWCIEVNTMPGFTTHSLLPMAARQTGLSMPDLTDRMVRLAAAK